MTAPVRTMPDGSPCWCVSDDEPHEGWIHAPLCLARRETAELQATFDLRWKADMRAIKRWQEAHPGNELVWPDHADMVVWLLELIKAFEDAYAAMDAATKWAAHQRPEHDTLEAADEHMAGYDALLDAQVRAGRALGILK